MTSKLRRAVWFLGAGQCVFWGVLYYGFSVLLVPIGTELQLPRPSVAGAFSLGLLVAALCAPRVGAWLDHGRGPALMRIGAAAAAAGLLLAAHAHDAVALYAAWALLGLAMAALLYEPAFALVIRAVTDGSDRLKALAAVTVLGGLASTLFLPLIAAATAALGWRAAEALGAVVVLGAAWAMERAVFPVLASVVAAAPARAVSTRPRSAPAGFVVLALVFVSGTFAAMVLTILLIPHLLERGISPGTAAGALAMLGLMQLPGRLWLLRGGHGIGNASRRLTTAPVALQASGLALVAAAPGVTLAAAGVALFGLGAGLQTLARPWLVQQLYGVQHAGHWNGRLARIQGFARAFGPLGAAGLAQFGGPAPVLLGAGLLLAATLPLAAGLGRAPAPGPRAALDEAG